MWYFFSTSHCFVYTMYVYGLLYSLLSTFICLFANCEAANTVNYENASQCLWTEVLVLQKKIKHTVCIQINPQLNICSKWNSVHLNTSGMRNRKSHTSGLICHFLFFFWKFSSDHYAFWVGSAPEVYSDVEAIPLGSRNSSNTLGLRW